MKPPRDTLLHPAPVETPVPALGGGRTLRFREAGDRLGTRIGSLKLKGLNMTKAGTLIRGGNHMGSTYQSTVVSASADAVWNKLRDFHDMSWAANVVESCKAVGEASGTEIGARRVLNDAFSETLLQVDDDHRVLEYSIDDGPSPVGKDDVDEYRGRVRVRPVTDSDHAFVEWSSRWQRNEEAVQDFCSTIYEALLADLKAHFA